MDKIPYCRYLLELCYVAKAILKHIDNFDGMFLFGIFDTMHVCECVCLCGNFVLNLIYFLITCSCVDNLFQILNKNKIVCCRHHQHHQHHHGHYYISENFGEHKYDSRMIYFQVHITHHRQNFCCCCCFYCIKFTLVPYQLIFSTNWLTFHQLFTIVEQIFIFFEHIFMYTNMLLNTLKRIHMNLFISQ